jgi:hypothetical protein
MYFYEKAIEENRIVARSETLDIQLETDASSSPEETDITADSMAVSYSATCMIRSPVIRATSLNLHWTVQKLGSKVTAAFSMFQDEQVMSSLNQYCD